MSDSIVSVDQGQPTEDAVIVDSREIEAWAVAGYRAVAPARIYSGHNLSVIMIRPAAPAKKST